MNQLTTQKIMTIIVGLMVASVLSGILASLLGVGIALDYLGFLAPLTFHGNYKYI